MERECKIKLHAYVHMEDGDTEEEAMNKLFQALDNANIAYQIYEAEEQAK